jgi:hypothetical protein
MLSLSEENSIQKNREEEKEKRIGGGLGSFVIAKKLQNTGVRDVVEPCKVCKGKNSERDVIIFKRSPEAGIGQNKPPTPQTTKAKITRGIKFFSFDRNCGFISSAGTVKSLRDLYLAYSFFRKL